MSSHSSNSTPDSGGSSQRLPTPSTAPTSSQSLDPNFGFPPPAPAPAQVVPCDDAGHCHASGLPQCDTAHLRICQGLPHRRTPPSYHGNVIHPLPNQVVTCLRCRFHDNSFTWSGINGISMNVLIRMVAWDESFSGHRNQLCHSCIRDEMELYWQRQGTNPPHGPRLSVHRVEQWPTLPNQDQNLCVCQRDAIDRWDERCHACRDMAFWIKSLGPYRLAERILRYRTRPVITGKKLCTINGGTAQHRVRLQHRMARRAADIGRMCPCGNKPKQPEPMGQEYITVCLGCMGVRIEVANLPAKYQQANMQPRRRSPRNHALKRTLGPRAAERSAQFRVNIERGWVRNDRFIGGR